MKQNKIIVGITGGSGSGKSTVSKLFEDRGCLAIDADVIARMVVEPGRSALLEIVSEYGEDVLQQDGSLNRKRLAGIVFSDPKRLEKLNEITHKYVVDEINKIIALSDRKIIAVDAVGIYEAGMDKDCDYVIAVLADKSLRIKRIMERDALTYEEAERRIAAQKDDAFYTQKADFVLYANGQDLSGSVDEIIDLLRNES